MIGDPLARDYQDAEARFDEKMKQENSAIAETTAKNRSFWIGMLLLVLLAIGLGVGLGGPWNTVPTVSPTAVTALPVDRVELSQFTNAVFAGQTKAGAGQLGLFRYDANANAVSNIGDANLNSPLCCVRSMSGEKLFVMSGIEVKVYDVSTGALLQTYILPKKYDGVYDHAMDISWDDQYLVIALNSLQFYVLDLATGLVGMHKLDQDGLNCISVACHPNRYDVFVLVGDGIGKGKVVTIQNYNEIKPVLHSATGLLTSGTTTRVQNIILHPKLLWLFVLCVNSANQLTSIGVLSIENGNVSTTSILFTMPEGEPGAMSTNAEGNYIFLGGRATNTVYACSLVAPFDVSPLTHVALVQPVGLCELPNEWLVLGSNSTAMIFDPVSKQYTRSIWWEANTPILPQRLSNSFRKKI